MFITTQLKGFFFASVHYNNINCLYRCFNLHTKSILCVHTKAKCNVHKNIYDWKLYDKFFSFRKSGKNVFSEDCRYFDDLRVDSMDFKIIMYYHFWYALFHMRLYVQISEIYSWQIDSDPFVLLGSFVT